MRTIFWPSNVFEQLQLLIGWLLLLCVFEGFDDCDCDVLIAATTCVAVPTWQCSKTSFDLSSWNSIYIFP